METGVVRQNALTENALTENALTENALTENALTENALTENALTENALTESAIADTASGRELLRYLAGCALEQGDVITVTVNDVEYPFHGRLGLASAWQTRELSVGEKEAISACLFAHVNHFGVPVSISIRGVGLSVSQTEADRFSLYEGAFFGDVFASPPVMYTCTGSTPPDFDAAYPNHDITVGDRLLRRCTDNEDPMSSSTLCGFTHVGDCQDVCDTLVDGSYRDCWTTPSRIGHKYVHSISTWLLAHDDADAVWTQHYGELYGPSDEG